MSPPVIQAVSHERRQSGCLTEATSNKLVAYCGDRQVVVRSCRERSDLEITLEQSRLSLRQRRAGNQMWAEVSADDLDFGDRVAIAFGSTELLLL